MYQDKISVEQVVTLLEQRKITATNQRVEIAHALLNRRGHFSADDVYVLVNTDRPRVSKATVYNTLGLFSEQGILRQVIVDPSRVFYDVNVGPHHHFFDADTGTLTDIPADQVNIAGIPTLPAGAQLECVDVIVRIRSKAA